MVGRKGEYLFRKPGSDVWRIRLQYPSDTGKPPIRRSLGTTDRAVAEIMAMPLIQAHKVNILRERQRVSLETILRDFPMLQMVRGGAVEPLPVVAGDAVKPITVKAPIIVPPSPVPVKAPVVKPPAPPKSDMVPRIVVGPISAADQAMLDTFLGLKQRNKFYEREARNEWNAFRAFVGGRAMKDCTRVDGRAYATYLSKKGLKSATVTKRINYLSAPIAHDPTFTDTRPNPFDRAVVVVVDDAKEILPFTDDDMTLVRDQMLPKLGPNEKLLWLMCATMGLRHSEAFSIEREHSHKGIRFVKLGQKTKDSKRDVPLPDCLLTFLPARIHGPLFTDNCKNVSKKLLRALRRVGITDPQKNVYSLRHRAHARLRRVRCPEDLQRMIVGHTLGHKHVRKDVHDRYGQGECLVDLTKPFVDQIGF